MVDLKKFIRDIPDFPQKGVVFKDISPLLKYHFKDVVESFVRLFDDKVLNNVNFIAGIDARGFILASALANHLNKGFLMIRKAGKLPPPVISEKYSLEYGVNEIEIQTGSGNVILVDDVLATGGTLGAAANLCQKAGYNLLDIAVLIDLKFLNDFSWNGLKCKSIIQYE